MIRFLVALLVGLALASAARAQPVQTAVVVSSCGGQSFTAGQRQVTTMDTAGNMCTNSSAGGGGSVTQGTNPWIVSGSGTAGTAASGVVTVQGIASMTKLLVTPDALPANQSVNISQINAQTAANGGATGSLLVEQGCAGQTVANTSVKAINNAASSANLKLVSKVSAQNVYICAINLVAAAATNVALVDGTKVTNECDTSTAGMAGGATAATGWNLAANGGLTVGNGQGVIFKTTSTNFDVCLFFSAGNQVSGSITYAQF